MAESGGGGTTSTQAVASQPLPSTRAKRPQLSAYGEAATIEVGTEDRKQTFSVHRGLLSFYSGYYKAALEGSWSEVNSGVIKLESEDPLVFERFVLWLYTNKITDEALLPDQSIIIDLWLFADRRDVPLLMNEMIDALHLDIGDHWFMPTDCLYKFYESTHASSALRCMLMWTMSRTMGADMFEDDYANRWPRGALLDMLRSVLADRPASTLSKEQYKEANMCPAFHVHEDGAFCADRLET